VYDDTFDPLAFLALADELVESDADEATLRTAIGRAYYALFLIARSKTSVQGRRNVHERVRVELGTQDRRLASLLGDVAYLRLVADYELVPFNHQFRDWAKNWERARKSVSIALQMLERLP
jgi:uncharacterized protein (UPF0332 family)